MRAALLLSLVLALPAFAATEGEQARAAFQKGQTEYNLGNYAKAAEYFEETYRLRPVPALLFNIAQCYRFMGNLDKAVQTYRAYLRNAPPSDKNIELAKDLLTQVEKADEQKKHAESAAPHGLAPEPGPPASKPAVVAVVDKTPASPPVTVPPAVTAPPPAPPPPAKSHTITWVTGGVAVAALAGGAYFGMQSNKLVSDLQTGFHTRSEIDSNSASAKSDASKANLLMIGGAILAVASGAFFVLDF